MRIVFALIIMLIAAPLVAATGSEVLLQGFHWESHASGTWYNLITSKAADLKAVGIDMVWFPPASDAGSDEGYLPRQLYKLDSKYGTQAQLVAAIAALHGQGIKAIMDTVINHRVGTTGWGDFTNPTWGTWSVTKDDEWGQGTGANDTGEGYGPARDLDHTNPTVQTDLKAWMNWLKATIGFDGWRYDYVKGFNGSYSKIYNDATAPYFAVGEWWDNLDVYNPDWHRQRLCDYINATGTTCAAFDFTTKGILGVAVNGQLNLLSRNSAPSGLIGWWAAKAVTFIDNHDTGSTQNLWPFPSDKVMMGYAYILTHPGTPSVFWPHLYDWGLYDQIKALIKVRKDNGLKSTSTVLIKAASANLYAAIIDSKVAVKIGNDAWDPGYGWTIKASGSGYAVWQYAGGSPTGQVRTVVFMQKETVVGQDIFIKGGHDAGLVPSKYPSMSEPITYLNTKNATTAAIKAADASLDWGSESALDWTCNVWPASWGTKMTYAVNGYGEDPENKWGLHWWKLDVKMDGAAGEWFEFKAFMRQGTTEWWESDRAQAGTPSVTINHWGKKGYVTRVIYNDNWVEFTAL